MLQSKLLFIKMDACTRQIVNYMAINIQFINDQNNLAIHTLAVRDKKAQHLSDYIKKLTESILLEYVMKDQVLAIVTDNASNMTSAVRKLNEEDEEEDPLEIVDDMVAAGVNNFVVFAKYPIEHMCVEYTLQLAIRDGLNDNHAANAIARYQKLVTSARAPIVDAIIRKKAGKGAILDQATRWGSTFEMINRLLQLRDALTDFVGNKELTMAPA